MFFSLILKPGKFVQLFFSITHQLNNCLKIYDTTTQQCHVKAKEMHRSVNHGFAEDIVSHLIVLELELANVYRKEQDSKYLRLYGS